MSGRPSTADQLRALDDLESALEGCLRPDRVQLMRAARRAREYLLRNVSSTIVVEKVAARLADLTVACERSQALRRRRESTRLTYDWPETLPISAYRDEFLALLSRHQVVIVGGSTGCGKSTQLPKLCLAAGRGIDGRIGHTQPRRLAASAIARRVADEIDTHLGDMVGYSVRFEDRTSAATRLKVMTDGVLLQEIGRDPDFDQYDTLIIDEVHERTVNIDILLGYLKELLPRRSDLKLIVTSATVDLALYKAFFPNAGRLSVPGREYPVSVSYRSRNEDDRSALDQEILDAIGELDEIARGDVLVFLPGEREIRSAAVALRRAQLPDTEILQLFTRLNGRQQRKIFKPGRQRRIILSTNVAETSLTVPRVRHVVDSGLARISRYSPRRKLQQLPVEPVSRDSADQRRGRCGREMPGICVRLYSEADYLSRRRSTEPEMQRTSLAGVVLRLKGIGVRDVERFPFLERPASRLLKDGYGVLQEIGALDAERRITALGRKLAAYPLDPRLARVLIAADEFGCLHEALIIVAGMSIQDPRERSYELRDAADRAHERFADKRSDFLWFVGAWSFLQEIRASSPAKQQRICRRHFLSSSRIREWQELYSLLARQVRGSGLALNREAASFKAIHLALLAGFPSLVAERQDDRYVGCRDASFVLHPVSILSRGSAKWILGGEIVETQRPYARMAARIDPAWIERTAGHLIKRTHVAPHWDARFGRARVTEVQRLFGLVLRADRLVDLARIDQAAARALFLSHGLVDGELGAKPEPPFLVHNRALVARIQRLEAKARRRDLTVSRDELCDFYAGRLPPEIDSRRTLLRWLRDDGARATMLLMSARDVSTARCDDVDAHLFPDAIEIAGTSCPLSYRFEPGHEFDGMLVRVPLVLLPRLHAAHLDRLVPGMLGEKVVHYLRSLPKHERRRFSPLRDFAMAALEAIGGTTQTLPEALANALARITGTPVAAELFIEERLPIHLRAYIELIDERGEIVAGGRDLAALSGGQPAARAAIAREEIQWGVGGSSTGDWNFGPLPVVVDSTSGPSRVRGYPALSDMGERVAVAVYDTPELAARMHLSGVTRLILLALAARMRQLARGMAMSNDCALLAARFGFRAEPWVYIVEACVQRRVGAGPEVRDAEGFSSLRTTVAAALPRRLEFTMARMQSLFERGLRLRQLADSAKHEIPERARADVLAQLQSLLRPGMVRTIERDGGPRLDRYLDALERRIERIRGNPGKDLQKLEKLAPIWTRFAALLPQAEEVEPEAISELSCLIEEYRINLFAPEIGAVGKISDVRLINALDALTEQM